MCVSVCVCSAAVNCVCAHLEARGLSAERFPALEPSSSHEPSVLTDRTWTETTQSFNVHLVPSDDFWTKNKLHKKKKLHKTTDNITDLFGSMIPWRSVKHHKPHPPSSAQRVAGLNWAALRTRYMVLVVSSSLGTEEERTHVTEDLIKNVSCEILILLVQLTWAQ